MIKRSVLIIIFSIISLMLSSCDSDITSEDENITSTKVVLTDLSVSSNSIEFSFTKRGKADYGETIIFWTDGTASGSQSLDSDSTNCSITSLSVTTKYTVKITANNKDGDEVDSECFSVTTTDSGSILFNIIYTAAELDTVRNNQNANYILMADIDLNSYASGEGWQPIGLYSGTFNGNGHTISNLIINRPEKNAQGLFGYIDYNKTITDLHLKNVSIIGNEDVGGLAGVTRDSSIISGCSVSGHVTGNGSRTGGLVGWADGQVESCYSTAAIRGAGTASGGLVGSSGNGISDSYATGNVSGNISVGGLAGTARTVQQSHATGTVSGTRSVGGLIGSAAYSIVEDCYATGSVHSDEDLAGGLIGNSAGSIADSYAIGDVTGAGGIGGLVGQINYSITNCHATGAVQGTQWAGGLAGIAASEISNCYATGAVTCTGDYAGGLVSSTHGPISNSYATGHVSGENYIGGLAGITEISSSTGDPVPVTDSYAMGDVSGADYVGGLVGSSEDDIIHCYSIGEVSGTNYVGGLLGLIVSGTIDSSYFNDLNTGAGYNAFGTATPLTDMTDQDTYIDWEFTTVWGISGSSNNGFPYLTVFAP